LDPRLFSYNSKHGWCTDCVGTGVKLSKDQRKVLDDSVRDDKDKGREQTFAEPDVDDLVDAACPTCEGTRLNATARAVKFAGVGITEIARLSVTDVRRWAETVGLHGRDADIARDLLPEIKSRLEFLEQVGLGYLTLGQPSPTLSGGEAQRIKLVTELSKVRDDVTRRGNKAPHTLYVLDEPTVGLHMADVDKLIRVLHRLVDGGHSVVVIEHDLDVIAEADWVIDLGPEGGDGGGLIVAADTPEVVVAMGTHTGKALKHVLARA
jgi:excinuclease ABC subunit A